MGAGEGGEKGGWEIEVIGKEGEIKIYSKSI